MGGLAAPQFFRAFLRVDEQKKTILQVFVLPLLISIQSNKLPVLPPDFKRK